jgi:hypothetical protein
LVDLILGRSGQREELLGQSQHVDSLALGHTVTGQIEEAVAAASRSAVLNDAGSVSASPRSTSSRRTVMAMQKPAPPSRAGASRYRGLASGVG